MKFLSLQHLTKQASVTFRRFPMAMLCAIAGSCCILLTTNLNNDEIKSQHLVQMILTIVLGMVSFTALAVFTARYSMRKTTILFFNIALLLLMIFYFYSLPEKFTVKAFAQFVILAIAAHLGVSFAPYLVNTEVNGFWQYNKTIFIRILTSALYTTVLFVGLSLALLAIDNLFVVHIGDKIYLRLWIILAGIFNTWFFLAGMPNKIAELQLVNDYPKGLRIFTSFVLLPLVTIYLLILYVYTAKILMTSNWPRGWVSYLVIGFSTSGILALLLVWPLRDDDKYKWIHTYTRGFFIALLPLIALLAFSIGRRVKDYGITENRYFVIILACWLLLNAFYFLFSRLKNIKFIPMTLFFTALISGFGPLNSFQVSKHSQLNRLTLLLSNNGLLKNGKFIKKENVEAIKDENEILSIMNYMVDVHGVSSVQQFFSVNLDSLMKSKLTAENYVNESYELQKLTGLSYVNDYENDERLDGGIDFSYSANRENLLKVSGYDYTFPFMVYSSDNKEDYIGREQLADTSFEWKYSADNWTVNIAYGANDHFNFELRPLLDSLQKMYSKKKYQVLSDELVLETEGNKIIARWQIYGLQGVIYKADNTLRLSSADGVILIKIKN